LNTFRTVVLAAALTLSIFGTRDAAAAPVPRELVPSSAPHGARIIVAGTGLDAPDLAIAFAAPNGGSVTSTIVSRSATIVEAVVPVNAVTGAVRVTGGGATTSFAFALLADPVFGRVTTRAASDSGHDVFKRPYGPAVLLPSGSLYVADSAHHQIRLVTANGVVALAAGTGKPGLVDGPAVQAQFKEPRGAVFDATRRLLYIADSGNHVIRILAGDGTVSTFAGSGRPESNDGNGKQAGFKDPSGLALDASGNLYVADSGNSRIRKVTPAGVVTTVAGGLHAGLADGPAAQSLLSQPEGVAIGPAGTLYIADTKNNLIRKLENGMVTTLAGTGHGGLVDGSLANAELKEPSGIAVDAAGNVYVADAKNHAIRRVTATAVTTIAGTGKPGFRDGDGATAQLQEPSGIALEGTLFVADTKNDALRVLFSAVTIADVFPRNGNATGGTQVRLFGSGFLPGATTVTIGGAAAVVTYVSSTELLVTVPPGAGSADVQATTPGGSATLAHGFSYGTSLQSLVLSRSALTLLTGATQQLTASARYSDGTSVDVTAAATWTSSAPSVATVNAGLVNALAAGGTIITATYDGISAACATTVSGPSLLNVAVSRPALTLLSGATQQLTASARYSDGTSVDVTAAAAWTSSAPAVASVTAGLVQALTAGSTTITAAYNGFSATCTATIQAPPTSTLPPDPATVATAVDPALPTAFATATAFLYTGADAIQKGVAAGAIEPRRVAVLRGRVLTAAGAPMTGVRIGVLRHPEVGTTLSRADGAFDLAVNGGGAVTLVYDKTGSPGVQRIVQVPWRDSVTVPDTVLIAYDTNVTAIAADAATTQNARGNAVTDSDGFRQATLLVPPHTLATMTLADGTQQPLTTLHVRATEYTVGEAGPAAMPAPLPDGSAYTYCVELSADEAVAAGAAMVTFDRPLAFYLENFLHFRVGGVVPSGYFDRAQGAWVPSTNGRVVRVVAIANGLAQLDIDGSGNPAGATALATLGVTDAELQQLATLYTTGTSLWRVPMTHFTPWDHNWPFGPPLDAAAPSGPPPASDYHIDDCNTCPGSIIGAENQSLGEVLPLTGAPFVLRYQSERAAGYEAASALRIPLTGDTVPASLNRVELRVTIAGRTFTGSFATSPNQTYTFHWDGYDAYGRKLQGGQRAFVEVGYVYRGAYLEPEDKAAAFAKLSRTGIIDGDRARQEITLWQRQTTTVGTLHAKALGLGGWTLSAHHVFDVESGVLFQGDGTQRSADFHRNAVTRIAGSTTYSPSSTVIGDGGPAKNALLGDPQSLAIAPDGSVYIADSWTHVIRKISPDGIISTIAGSPSTPMTGGDGGPAIRAGFSQPKGLALAPDGTLYVIDSRVVRQIAPNGIITTVAGLADFSSGTYHDGPALTVPLNPQRLAVSSDGTLYIGENGLVGCDGGKVRRLDRSGYISTVAGKCRQLGVVPNRGDGGSAIAATIDRIDDLAVGRDGSIYIADESLNRVRRILPSGIIVNFAGDGEWDYTGDGGRATDAQLYGPLSIAVGRDGAVYFADFYAVVRRVSTDGIITTVAGDASGNYSGDDGAALHAGIEYPTALAFDAEGGLYFGENGNFVGVRRIAPAELGFSATGVSIPSADGGELYEFSSSGRHLRTLDATTNATLLTFAYNNAGQLSAATDAKGNTTSFEHDASGLPTAAVAPGGQRTILATTADGLLASATDPAGQKITLTYRNELLSTKKDARGNTHTFTYDGAGRLIRDEDPAGGFSVLTRTEDLTSAKVSVTTAAGLTTLFSSAELSDGSRERRTVDRAGLVTLHRIEDSGAESITSPDGMTVTTSMAPDPRFHLLAPLGGARVRTPSGLTLTTNSTRAVVLANPANPQSVTRLTETTTINGQSVSAVFDVAARRWTKTSPAGRHSITTLDGSGLPLQIAAGTLAPVALTYDGRGRLTTMTNGPRTVTLTYDGFGRMTASTDSLGRTTRYTYDAADRVTVQTLADGRTIGFAYDANGNLTSVTPPGKPQHLFAFTPVDLASSYTPPAATGSGATQYAYDSDRRLLLVTRPDQSTIQLGYDGGGRLSTISSAAGLQTLSYAATSGQLTRTERPGATSLSYAYDGALLTSVTWTGAISASIGYTYDNDFRSTSEAVNGEELIAFSYDADSLLTAAGALTLNRDSANGLVSGTTLGSVEDAFTYNAFGEVTGYEVRAGGNSLLALAYTRDASGRIVTTTETDAGITKTPEGYEYDTAGRLVRVTNGSGTAEYDYDSNGNRTAHRALGGSTAATYDAQDRLLTYGDTTYTYTANGDLRTRTVLGQTTTFTYDVFGNLTTVAIPGRTIDYLIDAQNRRVGKKVNGALVRGWIYSDPLRIAAELDATGAVVSRFVYGSRANVPDYMIRNGIAYRIVSDHLGSPRLVVNAADGTIAQSLSYDTFGRIVNDSAPGFQPFGFAGGLVDTDTGLIRFGARDYDVQTGRWTAKDPLQFGGGDTNLYGYTFDDPINFVDPSGLKLCRKWLRGVGNTYLDDQFAPAVDDFLTAADELGVHDLNVTSAFRTTQHQQALRADPSGTGATTPATNSLHSAGWAIDVNFRSRSAEDRQSILDAADASGLSWGGNFSKPDRVHFYKDPTGGNKKLRKKLIKQAQDDYSNGGACGCS
jgi:RHS repeat-associated protein